MVALVPHPPSSCLSDPFSGVDLMPKISIAFKPMPDSKVPVVVDLSPKQYLIERPKVNTVSTF